MKTLKDENEYIKRKEDKWHQKECKYKEDCVNMNKALQLIKTDNEKILSLENQVKALMEEKRTLKAEVQKVTNECHVLKGCRDELWEHRKKERQRNQKTHRNQRG